MKKILREDCADLHAPALPWLDIAMELEDKIRKSGMFPQLEDMTIEEFAQAVKDHYVDEDEDEEPW